MGYVRGVARAAPGCVLELHVAQAQALGVAKLVVHDPHLVLLKPLDGGIVPHSVFRKLAPHLRQGDTRVRVGMGDAHRERTHVSAIEEKVCVCGGGGGTHATTAAASNTGEGGENDYEGGMPWRSQSYKGQPAGDSQQGWRGAPIPLPPLRTDHESARWQYADGGLPLRGTTDVQGHEAVYRYNSTNSVRAAMQRQRGKGNTSDVGRQGIGRKGGGGQART
jgi:hypothetical protein